MFVFAFRRRGLASLRRRVALMLPAIGREKTFVALGLARLAHIPPGSISQWCARPTASVGIYRISVVSVDSGVFDPVVRPRRSATLNTCVSTAIAAWSNTTERITLAVFRPTPGNFTNSSKVPGTSL